MLLFYHIVWTKTHTDWGIFLTSAIIILVSCPHILSWQSWRYQFQHLLYFASVPPNRLSTRCDKTTALLSNGAPFLLYTLLVLHFVFRDIQISRNPDFPPIVNSHFLVYAATSMPSSQSSSIFTQMLQICRKHFSQTKKSIKPPYLTAWLKGLQRAFKGPSTAL